MADAIVSVVVERIAATIEEQIRKEVNLVRGVDKEILNLSKELKTIRNVLDDADRKGPKEKSVKDWLKRLEDASYEMDDVLDEWNIALLKFQSQQPKVCCSFIPISPCSCFVKFAVRNDISKKIRETKGQLDLVLAEKDRYGLVTNPSRESSWCVQSTSLIDLAEVHGRDLDRDVLVNKVLMMPQAETDHLEFISIVGVGGVGKTTLAQLVFNDSRVKKCFQLRMWISVSDPFDEVGVAKKIVESVTGSSPNSNQLEVLVQRLKECISGKKFLLVMDDVWTENSGKWEPLRTSLKQSGIGSKVFVTTRNERVAKMMGTAEQSIHRLGQLSDETCWLILQRIALSGRDAEECSKFQGIGMNIASKCKGLPLATKALGSLLRFKNSLGEWEDVLHSEIWQLEEAHIDLFPHFLLSYNELSPALKRCFSYCAVFTKGFKIKVEKLIGNWMALCYLGSDGSGGDMELRGQQYFDNLAMRSLFQDFEKDELEGKIKECKMHDIVHDFAQFLRKNIGGEDTGIKKASCQDCSPVLVSQVKEYRSLFCNTDSSICNCLSSARVLSLSELGLQSITLEIEKLSLLPREIEKFIHLRWLDLSYNTNLSVKDLETISKLYNLQTLLLRYCNLKEIPWEIGNLTHLRHLNLADNKCLRQLPESICDLHELRTLNIEYCRHISRIPQDINQLVNLKHLHNVNTIEQFPQGLAQLTGLRTLGDSVWEEI
ncbi:putative disease resistance protein rga3 [Phtheirospermum japonicum]|uniref:Putative disease resistance protein rga3 n=1 Tax=Phtheirospermum japonicum TaxID=374723 RepID=A0A830CVC7_9LAMI|nr:putative disease resistance protein rga3 [Phtheirospermum japonicum]